MSTHRSRVALVCSLVFLAAVFPASAAARAPQSEHDRVVAWWTPARMAAAKPRDFTRVGDRLVPAARPGTGGGGNTTGASWNGGGLILRASGRVWFNMRGNAWICSGSVATDSRTGASLVLTAAHCAYDEQNRVFATNWMFIPEYDSAPSGCAVHGCWTAKALVVHNGYASAGGFNLQATLHDYAFAVVEGGGWSETAQLDATVGSFPIGFSTLSTGITMYAFGYPAGAPYTGRDLTYCAGKLGTDPWNGGRTWALPCTMTGGSSGGPWLSGFNTRTASGTLSSVNSYIYSGIKKMHGPKFNSTTQAVYDAADAATQNTVVGP